MKEAIEIEALGGEEVGVGGFIVGGEDEIFEIVRLAEAGVIVGDEFGAEVAGPVEDFTAVDGGEERAVGFFEVEDEGVGLGDDVFGEFVEHLLGLIGCGGWHSQMILSRRGVLVWKSLRFARK